MLPCIASHYCASPVHATWRIGASYNTSHALHPEARHPVCDITMVLLHMGPLPLARCRSYCWGYLVIVCAAQHRLPATSDISRRIANEMVHSELFYASRLAGPLRLVKAGEPHLSHRCAKKKYTTCTHFALIRRQNLQLNG